MAPKKKAAVRSVHQKSAWKIVKDQTGKQSAGKTIRELQTSNDRLRNENAHLSHLLRARKPVHAYASQGTIEGRIYIRERDAVIAFRVYEALQYLLTDLGATASVIDSVHEGSVVLSVKSWFVRWASKREVRRVASQLVQTAEAMTVEKAQAENASVQLNAVAALVTAGVNAGAISVDLGTLQYVQYLDDEGRMQVAARAVSSREIADKRIDEAMMRDPKAMLRELQSEVTAGGAPPSHP